MCSMSVDVLKIYEKDLYKQILAYGEVDQYKDMIAGRLEEYYQWTERDRPAANEHFDGLS